MRSSITLFGDGFSIVLLELVYQIVENLVHAATAAYVAAALWSCLRGHMYQLDYHRRFPSATIIPASAKGKGGYFVQS